MPTFPSAARAALLCFVFVAAAFSPQQSRASDLAVNPRQGGEAAPSGETRPPEAGSVRVEIVEQYVPTDRQWPKMTGPVTETYHETAFGFFHVPWRYTSTGVRDDRGNPFFLRAIGDVALPAGKWRLLLRSRSAIRVAINGERVGSLPFGKPMGDGHNPLIKPVLHLGTTRYLAPGDQETIVEFVSNGKPARVVLEAVIGGMDGKRRLRPETGEMLIAAAPQGSDDFQVLSPARHVPLTDSGWNAYVAERRSRYMAMEAQRRERARQRFAVDIERRHQAAREWAAQHPAPEVPAVSPGSASFNEVDAFLGDTVAKARAVAVAQAGSTQYHRDVLPLLSAKCLSCHGRKAQGGLRLDSLEAARRGGDSGEAALVPGDTASSELLRRVKSLDEADQMPPKGDRLTGAETALLEKWIAAGARWPELEPLAHEQAAPILDDLAFLRRLFVDLVGVPPTLAEIASFRSDDRLDKRRIWADRLLDDPRWADVWTPRWQDWLGENPNLVNATLNNTGPFRYWLHESFLDNKPMDLFVRELVAMEGSVYGGGPSGFGLAAQNDAPYAAKAGVIASAFLGVEMKCARCHDAPFHDSTQKQLFQLAGLLAERQQKVPGTSTVKLNPGPDGRQPLIRSTLAAGEAVDPAWPFEKLMNDSDPKQAELDSRAHLAELLTAPRNERFANVIVNRVWQHLMGRGLVENLGDWEQAKPTHPALLTWLSREFVSHGYDLKHVARLIVRSQAYQRSSSADPKLTRYYLAVPHRRLSAEQIVDSLFAAYGTPMDVGYVCIDLDGGRPPENGLNLGQPERAWQFAYLSNDRDRPSLNLPHVRAVTEVLTAFGWPEIRQEAISDRKPSADVTQSALLQNGVMSRWLTRLSDRSEITEMAVAAETPESLVRVLYLRILTREPTTEEWQEGVALLSAGFPDRHVAVAEAPERPLPPEPYVAWSNHLDPASTVQRQKEEAAARRGPPPTQRLDQEWRERCEDLLWSLLNSPEVVYAP